MREDSPLFPISVRYNAARSLCHFYAFRTCMRCPGGIPGAWSSLGFASRQFAPKIVDLSVRFISVSFVFFLVSKRPPAGLARRGPAATAATAATWSPFDLARRGAAAAAATPPVGPAAGLARRGVAAAAAIAAAREPPAGLTRHDAAAAEATRPAGLAWRGATAVAGPSAALVRRGAESTAAGPPAVLVGSGVPAAAACRAAAAAAAGRGADATAITPARAPSFASDCATPRSAPLSAAS